MKAINTLPRTWFIFFIGILFISSCKKEQGRPDFEIIQDEILTPNCANAGCHSSTGDASYAQHKLLLSLGNSYDALINKVPQNASAVTNGWVLVKPGEVDKSFLYHKITCETGHHSGNIGATMPLGGKVLTRGQVEFIKRWKIGRAHV